MCYLKISKLRIFTSGATLSTGNTSMRMKKLFPGVVHHSYFEVGIDVSPGCPEVLSIRPRHLGPVNNASVGGMDGPYALNRRQTTALMNAAHVLAVQ